MPVGVRLLLQRGKDLGQRLAAAVTDAFTDGAGPLLVIGTDAPTLTGDHLTAAFTALESHDVALGPALDGGYYLIGLRAPHTSLFALASDVWSTDRVLAATGVYPARRAERGAAVPTAGPGHPRRRSRAPLRSGAARADRRSDPAQGGAMTQVSIIVPVLNEEATIHHAVSRLCRDFPDCELIVVDGGSTDATAALAAAPRHRGHQ